MISLVDKKLVLQAIKVLREVTEKYYEDSSKKKPLLDEEATSHLFLQVTLKKIPMTKNIKMIRVNLPHSVVKDTSDICLITGDLDKKNHKADVEPVKLHYKELLDKHGISEISEVITLRQLRTEYRPFEAKQKLLSAFDVFLADSVILECLPKILGTHFFKKRKFPIRINMKTKNLKNEIGKAISSKMFYITGRGNSCCVEIAYLDMKNKRIVDNILAVVETLSKELPGSWDNILGIYLKTARSKAVPIYISHGNPNDVKLPIAKKEEEFEIDELTTIKNALVKVYKDGRVETVKDNTVHVSEIEEHKIEDIDLESPSQCTDEMVKAAKKELKSKKPESDHILKTPTEKKIKAKTNLALADDASIIELDVDDESDTKTKESKKGKRKSVNQTLPAEDNYKLDVDDESDTKTKESKKGKRKSVNQTLPAEDNYKLDVDDESDTKTKESKKGKRKSVNQTLPAEDNYKCEAADGSDTKNKKSKRNRKSVNKLLTSEGNCSNGTSLETKKDIKEFEAEDESDTKNRKSKGGNRKSISKLLSSEDTCSDGISCETKKDVKVSNKVEEEIKTSKKSKRKRTESESEFPIFGNLKSKPEFIRSQKKIRLDDSEVKNVQEKKQKLKNKKQNKRKTFAKK